MKSRSIRSRLARGSALLLAILVAGTHGCSLWRKPPPPPIPRADVIAAVKSRAGSFRTVKDTEKIKLSMETTVDGETEAMPSLGGAIAFSADFPGLYLYAEKLMHHVFTLKALRSEFSMQVPETHEVLVGGPIAYAKMPWLLRPDEVRGLFAGPDTLGLAWPGTSMAVEEDAYRFDVRIGNTLRRHVWVDRRQLVLTEVISYDSLGRMLTIVRLGKYKPVDGRLFPHRLQVDRPRVGVSVALELTAPQLDVELPEKTFRPTRPRGWQVIDLDYEDISAARFFREHQ